MAQRSVLRGRRDVTGKNSSSFKIEGLPEILDNLAAIVDKTTGPEMKKVFFAGAKVIRDKARGKVPVRTGLLRKNIFASEGDKGKPSALVGVAEKHAPHGHLIEYGTDKMAARPFLRPAITESGPEVAKIIGEGLKAIIAEHTE